LPDLKNNIHNKPKNGSSEKDLKMAAAKKGAAKKHKTSQQQAEIAALASRPTRHRCSSPKCPTPNTPILQKDLQPAGRPKGPMKMYHKDCWKSL
jgi:hypothetical protein